MSFRIPYLASQISATCRRGVSLLEVLFSIGIVAVGLLGIMVLLPVAGSRVAHGVVADMGDRVGRSAIRQFNVQLMRQPNVWAQYDSSTNLYQPFDRVKTVTDPSSSKTAKYPKSFCVDPLCVATLVASPSAYTAVAGYFPSIPQVSTADPRMDRISLRPAPGSGSGMTRAQAEQAFLYQDDLTVSLPDDRTLLPMQNFGTGNVKRQYEGRFSWLATLTPMPKDSNNIDTSESYLSDLYLLSIVVFHRRDLEMTLPAGTPGIEEPENERLVNVPTVYGNGELVLETRAGRPAVDLKLGQGEWVMLMAAKEIAKDYNNQPVYKTRFKWYRVLVVEPDTQATNSGTYQRNVTLFGQDWDADMLPTSMPQVFPQALLMNGVVAVYEKTIRLETSSLWTVQ